MTPLHQWATRHRVSLEAFQELRTILGTFTPAVADEVETPGQGKSEAWAQSAVRLEASQKGVRLYRNNVGALKDKSGRLVRFGLANDNAKLNEVFKSPDLVGWRPVQILPEHVGRVLGVCVLREMKEPGWQYTGDAHEKAQWAFLATALRDGCDAAFATGPGTL